MWHIEYVGESSTVQTAAGKRYSSIFAKCHFCWAFEKVSPDAPLEIATTAMRNSNNRLRSLLDTNSKKVSTLLFIDDAINENR